jgi:hypothetical protein
MVVFEAFFTAGLRLPAHRFVVEVLWRYDVQIHQLTLNTVVALAKYVWAVTSYGGQPSVEVFAKNYCLHWQQRKIGSKIAQFGSCTFTPRTGKTSAEGKGKCALGPFLSILVIKCQHKWFKCETMPNDG